MPPLTHAAIDASPYIVAQAGAELKADGTIATIAADQPGASGVATSGDGRRLGRERCGCGRTISRP